MKKSFLILLLSVVSIGMLQAQFSVGLNIGPAFNNIKEDQTVYKFSNYTSFYPEIQIGYALSSHWNVELGFGFSSKGYKAKRMNKDEPKQSYKFHYFSLPVYLSYQYPFLKTFYGKLLLGLQPNFYDSQQAPEQNTMDFQQMRHTIGAVLGAETGYRFSDRISFHLLYRYSPDLSYADKEESIGKLRSHYLLIGVRYTLNVKKQTTDDQN